MYEACEWRIYKRCCDHNSSSSSINEYKYQKEILTNTIKSTHSNFFCFSCSFSHHFHQRYFIRYVMIENWILNAPFLAMIVLLWLHGCCFTKVMSYMLLKTSKIFLCSLAVVIRKRRDVESCSACEFRTYSPVFI